jgi:hypothetical protein
VQGFTSALRLIFESARILQEPAHAVAAHYRTHIADSKATKTFSYWCFHPGIALRIMRTQHHIRCVILASGTLSPMDSWAAELGSPFPVRLENGHVIKEPQMWAGVVSVGPTSVRCAGSLPVHWCCAV